MFKLAHKIEFKAKRTQIKSLKKAFVPSSAEMQRFQSRVSIQL